MSRDDYNLYILSCADGSLYTGIACDVPGRMAEHRSGKRGAKYLRGRSPFDLVFEYAVGDRSSAQRMEHRVKRLSRSAKLDLIEGRRQLPGLIDDDD